MKKLVIFSVLLYCVFLTFFCGCNNPEVTVEETMQTTAPVEKTEVKEILNFLSKKYNKEFVVIDADREQIAGIYEYYCSPKDDTSLMFEAQKYTEDNFFSDNYINRKAATSVRNLYYDSNSIGNSCAYFELDNNRSYSGENTDISFEDYIFLAKVEKIYAVIVVDDSVLSAEKCELIVSDLKTLQNTLNNTYMFVDIYCVPKENYNRCKENFLSSTEIPEIMSGKTTLLKEWFSDYEAKQATVLLEDGESSVSGSELLSRIS